MYRPAALAVVILSIAAAPRADALIIHAMTEGPNGTRVPIQAGFRYLIEEDNSFHGKPGVATPAAPFPDPSNTLAVNIHKSHAPVVCSGDTQSFDGGQVAFETVADTTKNPDCILDPTKHYMVTVMPWHTDPLFYPAPQPNGPWFANQGGYTLSGRNVEPGQHDVDVVVHDFPVPTAQITLLVFKDDKPINGAFDQPAEQGLGGFNLLVSDIVGKLMQDAWGNPVGTTYKVEREVPPACTGPGGYCRPTRGAGGTYTFLRDPASGLPVIDYMGNGTVTSCPSGDPAYDQANCIDLDTGTPLPQGEAVLRFLAPNKYAIEPIPPATDPDWILTATLEGTRTNDAWVRAAEPRFNITLGQLNHLVFYGFVKKMEMSLPSTGPKGSITGQVVYAHDAHPPYSPGLSPGLPVPHCYVGLSNLSGADEQVYTAPCNADSTFNITNVPAGRYQLSMWDEDIKSIIDFRNVEVPVAGGVVDLGKVAVFRWFGTLRGQVFFDANGDGRKQPNEMGMAQQRINARYTDGSLYASQLTNDNGEYEFSQFFPWWRWVTVETDSARFKSTGATSVVDEGGPIPNGPYAAFGLTPQTQPSTGLPYRTQASGPGDEVLTQAMLLFSDMTNIIDWGKGNYAPLDNGGIRGFISYATSRTQEDPERSAWQSWEPGVPRVQVNLFNATQDLTGSWVRANCTGATCSPCDVDGGVCEPINSTFTDSWDDNNPTDCVGGPPGSLWANPQVVNGIPIRNCAETFRTWDQVRPGVFDGAYSFSSYCTGHVAASFPNVQCQGTLVPTLKQGHYIVEAVPPRGYQLLKWGDRNIEFGEPSGAFQVYPAQCVGPKYPVPEFHQLFPDWQVPTPYPAPGSWFCTGAVDPYGYCKPASAGPMAPSCTQKLAQVAAARNAIVDFRLFTEVPKSSRIWGWVSDDLHLETNPKSPNASSNFAPSWLPVAIKDWKGTEIARFYTDEWGKFDGLIPSTYTIYTPNPLGMSSGLYTIAPNDPGPVLDRDPASPTHGQMITDPWFNPAYAQEVIRENWDFYAGTTTFVDTIVLPIAAFVENRIPISCDFVDHTPEIAWVSFNGHGPLVPQGGGSQITIQSVGPTQQPNPDFNPLLPPTTAGCDSAPPPAGSNCAKIFRDHGFGAARGGGSVSVGGVNLTVTSWSDRTLTAVVPASVSTGSLTVTRDNPAPGQATLSSIRGVTLHVADPAVPVLEVSPPGASCDPYIDPNHCRRIQPAIDAAPNGALILVGPGNYRENVILYKPVQLQGWGAPSTILNGTSAQDNFPMKDAWNRQYQALVNNGGNCDVSPCIDIPPGEINDFVFEQGAMVMVSGCDPNQHNGACANDFEKTSALIDGLSITGATESGGGIYANSYAPNLHITNNEIYANEGSLSGGIRVGTPSILDGAAYVNSHNENLVISTNHIAVNGSLQSGGGGVSIYKGADDYLVSKNLICGNHSANYGGGIAHFGLSLDGTISENVIVSNEAKDEAGGVMVAGELVAAGSDPALTEGSGSVTIDSNLIQGNKAGDDGAGIRALLVNGQDVWLNWRTPDDWYHIDILNNMIVDNSSGDHGGAISLDDAVIVDIVQNTIANNDSTATGSGAFGGGCTVDEPVGQYCPPQSEAGAGGLINSIPRVAGIAAYAYSTPLADAVALSPVSDQLRQFSNPTLENNIIWKNRSFYWDANACQQLGGLRPDVQGICGPAEPPVYWDLAVYGAAPGTTLTPTSSDLTNNAANVANYSGHDNTFLDPLFVREYVNLYQSTSKGSAFGNFVNVTFTPNGLMSALDTLYGDYHLQDGSPIGGVGSPTTVPPFLARWPAQGNPFSLALQQLMDGAATVRPGGPSLEPRANAITAQWPRLRKDYDGQPRGTGRHDPGAAQSGHAERWFPW